MRTDQPTLSQRAGTAALLAALCLPVTTLAAPPEMDSSAACVDAASAQAFDAAQELYEHSRWIPAFEAFSALADTGHCDAARIALEMWRYGPSLFGVSFTASDVRLVAWRRINPPADQGRASARQVVTFKE